MLANSPACKLGCGLEAEVAQLVLPAVRLAHRVGAVQPVGERPALPSTSSEVEEYPPVVGCVGPARVKQPAVKDSDITLHAVTIVKITNMLKWVSE
eukprot:1188618-Prorocentrum_minimum.AAC.1